MSRVFLLDLAERTAATYLEAFIGLLLVGQITDLSTVKAAAVAAIPAALAVVKGAVSGFLDPASGASALPAPKQPLAAVPAPGSGD